MKNLLLILGVGLAMSLLAAERPLVVFNEDSDNAMRPYWHADTNRYTVADFERYYGSIVRGGKVSHLFFCVDARVSAFPSKVLPNYWDGLEDPAVKPPDYLKAMKRFVVEEGHDQFAIGISICRKYGTSPWLSIRMNDIHFPTDPTCYLNVGFWRSHPELWNNPKAREQKSEEWADYAFDYRHEEVRALMLAYLEEALARYDIDGIELDWMRFEWHAPRKVAATEGAAALNDFMRRARKVVAAAAKRRGHPVLLAARVDSDPVSATNHGMDWRTWAKEGLIDWLIACNFWLTVDFKLPYAAWAKELKKLNPQVVFLPGLDCGVYLKDARRSLTVSEYAGWGDLMFRQGAPGVYVFNLFCAPIGSKGKDMAAWDFVTKTGFTSDQVAKQEKSVPANAPRECVMGGWCQ